MKMAEKIGSELEQSRASAIGMIAELRAAFERWLNFRNELMARWETFATLSLVNAREINVLTSGNADANVWSLLDSAEMQAQARSPHEFFELHRQFLVTLSERSVEQMNDLEAILLVQARMFTDEIEQPRG